MIGLHPAADRAIVRGPDARHFVKEQVRSIVADLPASVLRSNDNGEDPALVRHIAVGQERYRLVVDLLPPNSRGERVPIATVERVPDHGLSERALRERFRLTRKESHVALLLAQRRSNAEIAQTLSISPHTARRHTENVMLKLNVNSRFSVEAALSREV